MIAVQSSSSNDQGTVYMSFISLGIHDGHTSTACLLVDGRIQAMASEERFNRIKSYGGPPVQAVEWLLESHGLSAADIDAVSFAGTIDPIKDISAYTTGRHRMFSQMTKLLPPAILASDALVDRYLDLKRKRRQKLGESRDILDFLRKEPGEIDLVEHHTAHAYAAYFSSGFQFAAGDTLVITCDGSGDGLCTTVSIARGNTLERIAQTPSYHSLGVLYSRVTQFLGMKPLEHEYKVMGLAPYAPEKTKKQAYDILCRYFSLSEDGLSFRNLSMSWGQSMLERLQRDLFLIRFDGVAAALQQLCEELLMQLVLNWVAKTGIRRVVLGGGMFMNVKFNMLLLERPEVEEVFFMPSGGDESVAIGAAYHAMLKRQENGGGNGASAVQPIGSLYFGHQLTEEEVRRSLDAYRHRVAFEKCEDIDRRTAELLAADKIVGRVRGRMEWGARALGNRSIVASPRSLETVRKINAAIKMRDFWMPFAPSILWERRHDYLVNPRDFDAPYMIVAFDSTELARKELVAGLHPFDLTCRPQLVREPWNPSYHRMIREFERLTGIGGVLNTSFNLHGDPIVMTAEDAISTLLNSGLDFITLEDYLVWRSPS